MLIVCTLNKNLKNVRVTIVFSDSASEIGHVADVIVNHSEMTTMGSSGSFLPFHLKACTSFNFLPAQFSLRAKSGLFSFSNYDHTHF